MSDCVHDFGYNGVCRFCGDCAIDLLDELKDENKELRAKLERMESAVYTAVANGEEDTAWRLVVAALEGEQDNG